MAQSENLHYFEDFEVGDTTEYGSHTVTKEEIIEFAERYDPQPFHVDEQAAQESIFGGLIASGWHTAAVCQKMVIESPPKTASRGGRGVDELRWHLPVYPGDTLSITTEVLEKRVSDSFPNTGYVNLKVTGLNQNDDPVISWILIAMFEMREPE